MNRWGTRVLVTGVAALAMVANACTSAPAGQTEKVDLVFQQFDPPDQAAGLQAAVDNWDKTHPDIQVTMRNVAFADALTTYVRETGSGSGADVLHTAFTWTSDLARNGQIVKLDDLIKQSGPENGIDTFLGREISTYNGSLYSLPFTADAFTLTYSPANFKAAGITSPPPTYDELLSDAAKLTTGSGADKKYGICFAASSSPTSEVWHIANVYLWSNGATFVAQKGDAWGPGATDAQLAQAISYYKQFLTKGYAPENLLSVNLGGDPVIANGLAKGTCAMAIQNPNEFTVALKTNPDLLSAPLPRGTSGTVLQMGGRSLSINPNSKHKDQAWQFIKYLTSKEVFQKYYTNQLPAQKKLLADKTFGPQLATPAYDGFAKSLPLAKTYMEYAQSPAPVPAIWAAVAQNFGAAFAGQKTPDAAAADLNKQLADLLKKK
jgi:multiple sugar transport system substrate-binding protein